MLAVPAQLPVAPGHFTGREHEVKRMEGLLRARNPAPIVAVTGTGGMGKTALTLHVAHRLLDLYDGGQLFIDLRGHDPETALTVGEALSQALRGLGVPVDRMPGDVTDRANLYRTLLRGSRMLILLDNAGSSAQIAPLVPVQDSCLVVTSRNRLAGIAVEYFVESIVLGALTEDESMDLLRRSAGPDRVDADPDAARRLVRSCGGMPLALRLAAAKIAIHPGQSIGRLAAELDDQGSGLAAFDVEEGAYGLRAAFANSYRTLSPAGARMFRLLSVHPGPTFSLHLATTVCGLPLQEAQRAADELLAAHILEHVGVDRYSFHDLVRRYAVERLAVEETNEECQRAVDALLNWYLALSEPVNRVTSPQRNRIRPSATAHGLVQLDDSAAVALLEAERDSLPSLVRFARDSGRDTVAWQLAYLLFGFFLRRGHGPDSVEVYRHALAAAERLGDHEAVARMCNDIGVSCCVTRRFDEALVYLRRALELSQRVSDLRNGAATLSVLGRCHADLYQYDEALGLLHRALRMATEADDRLRIGMTLHNIGDIHRCRGETDLALDYFNRAMQLRRETNHRYGMAITLRGIGQTRLDSGEHMVALGYFQEALAVSTEVGDQRQEAATLGNLALVYLALQRFGAAYEHCQRAVAAYRTSGDPHGEAAATVIRARVELAQGDLNRAAESLQRARDMRARVPDALEEARLEQALGDLSEERTDHYAAMSRWSRAVLLYQKANALQEAAALGQRLGAR
jgi:tetratricopeptide (TPR) repeat protein